MKNDKLPREAECKRTGGRFNELTDSQLAIPRRWKKLPWFFAAFNVVESYGEGLLEIAPLGGPPLSRPALEG